MHILQKLFDDEKKGLALIINERMMNIPHEIVPPLHRSLYKDIRDSIEEALDKKFLPFQFSNYIMLTSCYQHKTETKKRDKKKTKAQTSNDNNRVYFKPEDEIYVKESTFQFSYPIAIQDQQSRWTLDAAVTTSRLFLVFPASKTESIVNQIDALLSIKS